MTTLADMTEEERADCVGMWCEDKDGALGIYMGDYRGVGVVSYPASTCAFTSDLDDLTPCPELPRAWTPDGQPVPGEWEDGHVVVSYDDPDPGILKNAVSIEGLSEGGMSYYDAPPNGIEVKLDKFGEGEGKARRWVGEWEQE